MSMRMTRAIEWLIETLSLSIGDAWTLVLAWLRRPRHKKHGTLPPVIVTQQGAIVPSIAQVPIRSTRADAKREALKWARTYWKDPTLTWGQARKRIRKLEMQARTGQLDARAIAAIEAMSEE